MADALERRTGASSTSRRRGCQRLSEKERNRRIDLLRLAESLGAETVTLDGPTAGATIAEYAQTRKATRVHRRRAEAARFARAAAPLDGDRARAARSRLRRRDDRADGRSVPTRGAQCRDAALDDRDRARVAAQALRLGRRDLGRLHGARLVCDVPVLRAREPRHGLPARRDGRGPAARPRPVGADGRAERDVASTSSSCRRASRSRCRTCSTWSRSA